MEQEDDFLASKYVEYRKACREAEAFTPFMPYGWFKPPQTVRLDSEFGLQRMAYRDLADGEQPDMALIAVVHTLAAQTFYRGGSTAHCLEISPTSNYLAAHADGIEDTVAAKMLADRNAGWAADMPRDVADLWGFVAGLDHVSLMALLAHCASLTVNAVKLPWESGKRRAHETADKLATAVTLDMTAHWTPTVRTYFGRVTKAHILAAVREAFGDEAAERIADKKKVEMAEAAEQLLAGTAWLPPVLRTVRPAWLDAETEADAFLQAAE